MFIWAGQAVVHVVLIILRAQVAPLVQDCAIGALYSIGNRLPSSTRRPQFLPRIPYLLVGCLVPNELSPKASFIICVPTRLKRDASRVLLILEVHVIRLDY